MKKLAIIGLVSLLGCGSMAKTSSITIARVPDQFDTSANRVRVLVQSKISEPKTQQSDVQVLRMEQEGLREASRVCSQFGNERPFLIETAETRDNNILTVEVVVKCR